MSAKQSSVRVPTPPPFKRLLLGGATAIAVPRPTLESFIRLRPHRTDDEVAAEAQCFLEALGDDLLTLDVNLGALDDVLDRAAYDPSVQAAARCVRIRLDDMRELREALAVLHMRAADPVASALFHVDTPLSDYVRGVAAWCIGVVRALEALATELSLLAPDWVKLRARLESSAEFFVHGLARDVRDEVDRLGHELPEHERLFDQLAEDLETLFAAAEWLSYGLSLRFG